MKLIRVDDILLSDDPRETVFQNLLTISNNDPCVFCVANEVQANARNKWFSILEKLPPGYRLILDRAHQSQGVDWPLPVEYTDWHLLRVKHAVDTGKSHNNKQWNSTSNKFLFLTGKPQGLHRIKLLWMYEQANLLPRAIWSLFRDANTLEKCGEFLPELDNFQLDAFLTHYQRNPDNIELEKNEAQTSSSTWWKKEIYEQTSLNVISATQFDNNSFDSLLCEKIWKPMINYQPFIVAGQKKTLERLNNLGFKTFEQYMLHPDYSTESNPQEKLKKIVANSAWFLDNINQYQEQVSQDIEHNYNQFFAVADANMTQLREFVEDSELILEFTGRHL